MIATATNKPTNVLIDSNPGKNVAARCGPCVPLVTFCDIGLVAGDPTEADAVCVRVGVG